MYVCNKWKRKIGLKTLEEYMIFVRTRFKKARKKEKEREK